MFDKIAGVLKWIVALGSMIGLLILYRSIPLVGDGALEGLTRFDLVCILVGLVCMVVLVFSIKRANSSGRKISSMEKGSNAVLVALALILLELGIVGLLAGVNIDKNKDPKIASMRNCYVTEASVVHRVRGIDAILVCTTPSGKETIFAIDRETADKLGSEKQDLTIEYYENTNRIVSIS